MQQRSSTNQKLALWLALASILTVSLCLWGEHYLSRTVQDMQPPLDRLEAALNAEDWQQADAVCREVNDGWQQTRLCWLGLINHQDVTNIDTAMLSLSSFIRRQNTEEAYNQLALLRYYSLNPIDGNIINWSNIF